MKKFKVIFDIELIRSISGEHERIAQTCETIEADDFEIGRDGTVIFTSDDGSHKGAVPDGVWKMIKEV